MTTTDRLPAALPSYDSNKIKMEDRKRSLAVDAGGEDLAPRKRLVKDENGQAMRMDSEKEREVEVRDIVVMTRAAPPDTDTREWCTCGRRVCMLT